MGLIAMSERDLQRIQFVEVSERQIRRLLDLRRTRGTPAIRHKPIGRPSDNRPVGASASSAGTARPPPQPARQAALAHDRSGAGYVSNDRSRR